MKIVTDYGLYRKIEEQDYTPEAAELHYWYSGTHAGLDPKNPYARKRTSVTRIRYIKTALGYN